LLQQLYDQYGNKSLTEFGENSLETKYEDYRMLVKRVPPWHSAFPKLMDEKCVEQSH
jgi:peptidyl-prolyl cis-trans isomerase SurA